MRDEIMKKDTSEFDLDTYLGVHPRRPVAVDWGRIGQHPVSAATLAASRT